MWPHEGKEKREIEVNTKFRKKLHIHKVIIKRFM